MSIAKHPLDPDSDPLFYHVYGTYPAVDYLYHEHADVALNLDGWCDYSVPSNDRLIDCASQKQVYWSLHEIQVLLKIMTD